MSSRGSVIGVDPSIDHPAFAVWPASETWRLRTRGQGAERLRDLYAITYDWTRVHAPDDLEAVFIERPTGRFPQPALYQGNGVIQVAIMLACEQRFPHPVSIWELSPGGWKRRSVGKGNASKDEYRRWVDRLVGHEGPRHAMSEDEAAALCIAFAGHSLVRTEQVPASREPASKEAA